MKTMKDSMYQKFGIPENKVQTKRDYEAYKASEEAFKIPNGPKWMQDIIESLRDAFIKGVKWADNHPDFEYVARLDNAHEVTDLNLTEDD